MESVWKIQYVGTPRNPRFRVNKRRTARIIGNEQTAKAYAEALARGQHVKILSVQEA